MSKREYSKEERQKAAEQAIRRVWTLHPSEKIIARTVKEMTDETPREVPHTFLAKDVIDLQCELNATRRELEEAYELISARPYPEAYSTRSLSSKIDEDMVRSWDSRRELWLSRNAPPSQSAEKEIR